MSYKMRKSTDDVQDNSVDYKPVMYHMFVLQYDGTILMMSLPTTAYVDLVEVYLSNTSFAETTSSTAKPENRRGGWFSDFIFVKRRNISGPRRR